MELLPWCFKHGCHLVGVETLTSHKVFGNEEAEDIVKNLLALDIMM